PSARARTVTAHSLKAIGIRSKGGDELYFQSIPCAQPYKHRQTGPNDCMREAENRKMSLQISVFMERSQGESYGAVAEGLKPDPAAPKPPPPGVSIRSRWPAFSSPIDFGPSSVPSSRLRPVSPG